MKVVFNTRQPEAVGPSNYIWQFDKFEGMNMFDWDSYNKYDVALFHSLGSDHEDMYNARQAAPNLKIGVIDPRGVLDIKYENCFDFIIIDGVEMKDFFVRYRRPIHVYYEYPEVKLLDRKHTDKKPVVIAYQGNRVHLESMYPRITAALDLLSDKYDVEFWAMYNIEALGKWNVATPKRIPVKHIQWSEENYYKYMAKADIGIVPNLMPIRNIQKAKRKTIVSRLHFLDAPGDYLLKFKVPSNASRIFVFARLGLPVVADMYPSALQYIKDGESGFIASSTGGWYSALEKLIHSPDLRQKMASNLFESIQPIIDPDNQNRRLREFLSGILNKDIDRTLTRIDDPPNDLRYRYSFWIDLFRRKRKKAKIWVWKCIPEKMRSSIKSHIRRLEQ